VFRVASGNFLEMYDFMILGYFSAAIGRVAGDADPRRSGARRRRRVALRGVSD